MFLIVSNTINLYLHIAMAYSPVVFILQLNGAGKRSTKHLDGFNHSFRPTSLVIFKCVARMWPMIVTWLRNVWMSVIVRSIRDKPQPPKVGHHRTATNSTNTIFIVVVLTTRTTIRKNGGNSSFRNRRQKNWGHLLKLDIIKSVAWPRLHIQFSCFFLWLIFFEKALKSNNFSVVSLIKR